MLRKVIFTCTHGFRPGGEEMKYAAKQNWMLQMYAFAAKMSHTRHNHLTQQTPNDGSICASCAGPSPEARPTHSMAHCCWCGLTYRPVCAPCGVLLMVHRFVISVPLNPVHYSAWTALFHKATFLLYKYTSTPMPAGRSKDVWCMLLTACAAFSQYRMLQKCKIDEW